MNLIFVDRSYRSERREIADAMDAAGAREEHDLIEPMTMEPDGISKMAVLKSLHFDRQWQIDRFCEGQNAGDALSLILGFPYPL